MKNIKSIFLSRWFWVITTITFSVSRFATLVFPFDSDHWIFYYIGKKWISGATLYVDVWDHKSPLIYLYNGLLHVFFGDNLILQRILFTIIALLALILFYKTAQKLIKCLRYQNAEFLARISTLLFAFFANLAQFTNSGNNNENLGLVFILLTLYLYLIYRQNPVKYQLQLLLAGIAASFIFILKANFSILLLPIVIDLIWLNRKNIYRLIGGLAMFAFGTFLHLLIWAFYFKHMGTFKQFYIATFQFNSKYIKALGWDLNAPGIKIFIGILLLLLIFFIPFIINALIEFKKVGKNLGYLVPLMAASVVMFMLLAGTFYSHYFLIVIPYLCLIFGVTANQVFKKLRLLKLITLTLIIILMFGISLKLGVYNNFYGSSSVDLKNQKVTAQYINDHTSPSDTIWANLYGASFYELANRDSGSRFISASHPLIDYKYNFGYDFNRQFIFDMVDSEAKYVVMSTDKNDIYRVQNPHLIRFINNNYKLETTVGSYDIYKKVNK